MNASEHLEKLQGILEPRNVSLWEWLILDCSWEWEEQDSSAAYYIDLGIRLEEGWYCNQLFLPHANLKLLETAEIATWEKEWVTALSLSQAKEIVAERAEFKDPDIAMEELLQLRILSGQGFKIWKEIRLELNGGPFFLKIDRCRDKDVYHSPVKFHPADCSMLVTKGRDPTTISEAVETGAWGYPQECVMPAGWRSIVYNP